MHLNLKVYRIISFLLLFDIIAIVWFLTISNRLGILISAILFLTFLIMQVFLVKCSNCGTRPGLWLLAVWTLLLDFELYFADTVLLKACFKCDFELHKTISLDNET